MVNMMTTWDEYLKASNDERSVMIAEWDSIYQAWKAEFDANYEFGNPAKTISCPPDVRLAYSNWVRATGYRQPIYAIDEKGMNTPDYLSGGTPSHGYWQGPDEPGRSTMEDDYGL